MIALCIIYNSINIILIKSKEESYITESFYVIFDRKTVFYVTVQFLILGNTIELCKYPLEEMDDIKTRESVRPGFK